MLELLLFSFLAVFLAVPCHATPTASQQLFQDHNSLLYNDLFSGYHRDMSPYNGHGIQNDTYPHAPITIALQYARLIRVTEPELQHQNMVGMLLEWQDPRLRWDPAEYGGIDHIYVNRFSVWMPEFYPCESSQSSIVSSDQSLVIELKSTGFMITFLVFSSFFSCEFDVYRFPFDTQNCYYCFVLFNYNAKDELRFNAKYSANPYIYDTSEWSLKFHGTYYLDSIDTAFNMGALYYNISLTRRPQFYVGLVITPTFLIGSLIIIGLFFGRGGDIINNAVGLGLTTMMSMMVIVSIMSNSFAKGQYIPVLGWYIIAEIVIIVLAVMAVLSSEIWCGLCSSMVQAACRESKNGNCLDSVRCFIRTSLLERGKQSNIWLFSLFFIAHTINIVVLFSV